MQNSSQRWFHNIFVFAWFLFLQISARSLHMENEDKKKTRVLEVKCGAAHCHRPIFLSFSPYIASYCKCGSKPLYSTGISNRLFERIFCPLIQMFVYFCGKMSFRTFFVYSRLIFKLSKCDNFNITST